MHCVGGCSDANLETILRLTKSFMLRRHTCRERANENEIVFARLCGVDCSNPVKEVIEEFRRYCPTDDRFQKHLCQGRIQCKLDRKSAILFGTI